MKSSSVIKHDRFMDVAIYVNKVFINYEKGYYKIKGIFINQAYVESFPINEKIKFKIEFKDKGDWSICNNPWAKCLRDQTWRPL